MQTSQSIPDGVDDEDDGEELDQLAESSSQAVRQRIDGHGQGSSIANGHSEEEEESTPVAPTPTMQAEEEREEDCIKVRNVYFSSLWIDQAKIIIGATS